MSDVAVGVLALQGAVEAHLAAFRRLGVAATPVRRPEALAQLTHLVLPGGESTTLHHLLTLFSMWEPIEERCRAGALQLFGTCAGAILVGKDDGTRPPRMGLLDAVLSRNAYGRQVDSFTREFACEPLGHTIRGVFIRAPRFASVGPDARVLARLDGEPVLVEGEGVLAATFHPELSGDDGLHRYFLEARLEGAAPALAAGAAARPAGE